jgi:hypothetical protein
MIKAKDTDLSKYKIVFCESIQALEWAYKNGLRRDATIKASSPAMLWNKNPNIKHIEDFWSRDNIKKFQLNIEKYSIDIYDSIVELPGISHEVALCVARDIIRFDRVLFKAACLTKKDLNAPILFISLSGKFGPDNKSLNAPWELLLENNNNFSVVKYELDRNYRELTTKGITWFYRAFLAGYETIFFHFIQKLHTFLNLNFFKKQIIVPRENELLTDISYQLIIRGVKVNGVEVDTNSINAVYSDKNKKDIFAKIHPIVCKRFKKWALDDLNSALYKMLCNSLNDSLNIYAKSKDGWEYIIKKGGYKSNNTVLMSSVLSNTAGCGMASAFRKYNIPIVSVQHGVSPEISENQATRSTRFDSSLSDCSIVFNEAMKKTNESSYFTVGNTFVSGISARHLRVAKNVYSLKNTNVPDIVFVSTCLFRGNIAPVLAWFTDYARALKEQDIIENVLAKLPCVVRYKSYPEENSRYADPSPNIEEVRKINNIELFDEKIDMRFLVRQHRVLITTGATSTLSWLVLSNKPVVFIIFRNSGQLAEDIHEDFKKGIFVFYDDEYSELYKFLSCSLNKIEELWMQKELDRKVMINRYFTKFNSGSGKRAAKMILNNFFKK